MKKYIIAILVSCLTMLPSIAQTQRATEDLKWDISAGAYINAIGSPKAPMQAVAVGYNIVKGWKLGLNLGYMQGGRVNHPPVHGFFTTVGIAAEGINHSSGFSLIPMLGIGLHQSWGKKTTSKTSFVSDLSMSLRYMITPTFYSAVETRVVIPNATPRAIIALFAGCKIGIRF